MLRYLYRPGLNQALFGISERRYCLQAEISILLQSLLHSLPFFFSQAKRIEKTEGSGRRCVHWAVIPKRTIRFPGMNDGEQYTEEEHNRRTKLSLVQRLEMLFVFREIQSIRLIQPGWLLIVLHANPSLMLIHS